MKKKIIILLALAAVGIFVWLWYDTHTDHSGFIEENGIRYYQDFHGDRVTGWQEIDGNRYYFDETGAIAAGWQTFGENRCYFGADGALRYGWHSIDGGQYYFDPEGIMVTGWQDIDGSRYYFAPEGSMTTGMVTLDGKTYCFSEAGVMVTGWMEGRYYLPDGSMAVGEQEIEGKQHLFNNDGTPCTGWLEKGEYRYYYLEDGSAAVGPTEIDGETWYFTPSGIQIHLVNAWNLIPEDYDPDLVTLPGGFQVSECCSEALQNMLNDCQAAGLYPILCSSYRNYWTQVYLHQHIVSVYGLEQGSQIVAPPNASEHQLGLAVDIVDRSYQGLDRAQERTAVQKWLMEHCWEYGFILRYPTGKTDITNVIYEPWHYRYVGVEVAMELKDSGLCLEEYLGAAQ